MTPRRFTKTPRKHTSVRFYLNTPKRSSGSVILMLVRHYQFNFKLSTGQSIAPADWNANTQRPRRSHPFTDELTAYLDSMEHTVKRLELEYKVNRKPLTAEAIRSIFSNTSEQSVPKLQQSFYDAFNEYLNLKKGKLSGGFLTKMATLKKLVREFEERYSYPISFESINMEFYERFTSYLTNDRGQLDSTSNKYMALLKSFLNWSLKLKKHQSVDFKDSDFKSNPVDSELIALTLDEVMSLFSLNLVAGSRLYNVREFFCFQCFTGLRYSEVMGITEGNIRGTELYFREHKTKALRVKALNDQALTILERNGYCFHGISNQKLNAYIKELACLAGINTPVQVVKYRGSERIEIIKPKHEFCSSHVARASYITISLQLNVPAEVVKKDTGHHSDSAFRRYIRFAEGYSSTVIRKAWSNQSVIERITG